MSIDRHLQEKIYRLETLRKYQAYYGPNTPQQIIAEINQLEAELRRMLKADVTRPTKVAPRFSGQKPRQAARAKQPQPPAKKKAAAKSAQPAARQQSQLTTDLLATVAFVGLVLLLGTIVFIAYLESRPSSNAALAQSNNPSAGVILRPTFTPTVNPNAPGGAEAAGMVVADNSLLPPAQREPTPLPTMVPTLTPSPAPLPSDTPTPLPTNTPPPTLPPPPPQPTATPAPPTPVPAPTFPFSVTEQGNRMFQSTSYHGITIYVAIVSEGNIPMGGYKIVGDHVPSGQHAESALSTWNWSVTNCLDCDYVKFGNVKFEPGSFEDGTWNIYVADEAGNKLSDVVPLSYSADPAQWVWDFVIFQRNSS